MHVAGRSHLEILRRLADVAIAVQARAAAVFSPPPFSSLLPPFRGEVGRGVPRAGARGGGRRRVIPPGPPSRGEERNREDARSPPTLAKEANRRLLSSSLLFSPPPFQGGGRVGGPAPAARGWGGGVIPPAPLPGGDERVGRRGAPMAGGAVGGRRINPPPDLPPSRGEERNREGVRTAPTLDQGADRCRLLSSPLTLLSSPLKGGGREGGRPWERRRSQAIHG